MAPNSLEIQVQITRSESDGRIIDATIVGTSFTTGSTSNRTLWPKESSSSSTFKDKEPTSAANKAKPQKLPKRSGAYGFFWLLIKTASDFAAEVTENQSNSKEYEPFRVPTEKGSAGASIIQIKNADWPAYVFPIEFKKLLDKTTSDVALQTTVLHPKNIAVFEFVDSSGSEKSIQRLPVNRSEELRCLADAILASGKRQPKITHAAQPPIEAEKRVSIVLSESWQDLVEIAANWIHLKPDELVSTIGVALGLQRKRLIVQEILSVLKELTEVVDTLVTEAELPQDNSASRMRTNFETCSAKNAAIRNLFDSGNIHNQATIKSTLNTSRQQMADLQRNIKRWESNSKEETNQDQTTAPPEVTEALSQLMSTLQNLTSLLNREFRHLERLLEEVIRSESQDAHTMDSRFLKSPS